MGFIKNILYSISNKKMISLINNQTIFPYYHIVKNKEVKHIKNLYKYKDTQQFEKDVKILIKYYKPINPKSFINSSEEIKIPKNSFLLTFDDGLSEVYDIIIPILKKYHLSAIFFINPDFIDNKESLFKHDISIIVEALKTEQFSKKSLEKIKEILSVDSSKQLIDTIKKIKHSDRHLLKIIAKKLNIDLLNYVNSQKPYLTKENIKEMIDLGFYFGGHTMSHPRLQELGIEKQIIEILDSIKWLKSNFDIDYSLFAFPFWDKGIPRKLIDKIFEYDDKAIIFGNSGIKKDIYPRMIQRFSLENPNKNIEKTIVTENFYKFYNKIIGQYKIHRN